MRANILTTSILIITLFSTLTLYCAEVPQQDAAKTNIVPDSEDLVENSTFSIIITIRYSGTSATVSALPSGITASVSNGDVVINSTLKEVEYILSGSATDGSFKIYSDNKFKLTFDGVDITNRKGPAINIQSGKRGFVVLKDGTANKITDGQTYTPFESEDMKACLFSEGQLIFSGKGTLAIRSYTQHGICSDDYIRIREGVNITITDTGRDGIHVNDYLLIDGGNISIKATSDGIDIEKGDIQIKDGNLTINTAGDSGKGIKAKGNMEILGGNITINTTGNAVYENNDISSSACIKIDGTIRIAGKDTKLALTSSGTAGKGISCDSEVIIDNGTINIATTGNQFYQSRMMTSSAKGIKSEGNLTINGGNIKISATGGEGSEGLESKNTLIINGGEIEIFSYDDGINASRELIFNGGNIWCLSTNNDAIDSNGTLTITGGLVIAHGAEDGFDCDRNTFKITGGTAIGLGGGTSMPTTNVTTQPILLYGIAPGSGEWINIQASNGKNLMTYQFPRDFTRQSTLLFSSPDLKENAQFTVNRGGRISGGQEVAKGFFKDGNYSGGTKENTFTQTSLVTTVGEIGRGFGGFGGGGRGGPPGGGRRF